MTSQDLRITVFENGVATCRGDLAFADERGASIVFSSSPAPALFMGQQVSIGFPGIAPKEHLALVRVVERRDEIGSRIFGFHFESSDAWQLLMSSPLGPFFCRRREQRVRPAPAEPIWVSLTDGSGHFGHRQPMFDISLSGLGLRVSPETDVQFRDAQTISLSFQLPNSGERLYLDGVLRHRSLQGNLVHYGIVFLAKDPARFEQQQAVIAAYMATRCEPQQPKNLLEVA